MIILAYSDGKGITAPKLTHAVEAKAKEISFKDIYYPENGIHPEQQLNIVDELLQRQEDIIVATHSEFLMLRALRRYNKQEITKKDFKILQYIKKQNNVGYYWTEREYDEDGLIDNFIGGCFEQGYYERFEIEPLKTLSK